MEQDTIDFISGIGHFKTKKSISLKLPSAEADVHVADGFE